MSHQTHGAPPREAVMFQFGSGQEHMCTLGPPSLGSQFTQEEHALRERRGISERGSRRPLPGLQVGAVGVCGRGLFCGILLEREGKWVTVYLATCRWGHW